MMYYVVMLFYSGDLEVSGMMFGEVQVGVEGSIRPVLLKAHNLYLKQGLTGKL